MNNMVCLGDTVRLRLIDCVEGRELEAAIADCKGTIITFEVDRPILPGTKIIFYYEKRSSMGEVTDWEWDYMGINARLHVYFPEWSREIF